MPVNIEKYRQYVDHCDMTEEQKVAFLETLWSIMESFVDDAWGITPAANDNERSDDENSSSNIMKLIDYSSITQADETTQNAAPGEGAASENP